jgi:Lrp/AsnC family leucine-responsive transcriptional regulator
MEGMMDYLFKDSGLDKIDIRMLDILRNNARAPLTDIAKKCRVSKQTALYRINKLVKEKVIKGFHAYIDFKRLGYMTYYAFIQTRYIENEEEFIKELERIGGCIVIMKSITQYSYSLKIVTKDVYKMMLELQQFFMKKKVVTSHFILEKLERPVDVVEMDDKDKRILEELSVNCRLSSLELSKITGLSYDVVHNRLKRMINDRVIEKFLTVLDFEREGFMYYNVLLKFADDRFDDFLKFNSELKLDPLVVSRFGCVGEFSYMFEIVDNNYVHINEKINKIRSQFHDMIRSSQIVPIQNHYFYRARLE